MKKSTAFVLTSLLSFGLLFASPDSHGQLWKKIKNEVKNRAENKVVNKAGNSTDKAIDKTTDAMTGKPTGNTSGAQTEAAADESTETATTNSETKAKPKKSSGYTSYDFVPGDKIIFEPDLSQEPDAELPARFTLHAGNAEIQTFEGEKILHLDQGGYATVSPLMDKDSYLPEQFTVEFDFMYENEDSYFRYSNDFLVQFRKAAEEDYKSNPFFEFKIESNTKGVFNGNRQGFAEPLANTMSANHTWHHMAIYIRKNIGKVYIDQYRVAASNTLPVGPEKMNLRTDYHYGFKIKNFRLAAGGDDKYNKIVTDGKFVTHGILFDVNQSSIKPESMGTLNEVVKMMKSHADLNFEIDGHTDSDGKAETNQQLSQQRADAVKAKLVEMGIAESRLTTKGFGASKPIGPNDNAEGKANNRRVEFVKI